MFKVAGDGQVTATGFTGTLDGLLGSVTPAAAQVTTLDSSEPVTATLTAQSGISVLARNTHASFNGDAIRAITTRASNSGFNLINCLTGNGAEQVFKVGGDGLVIASTFEPTGDTSSSDNAAIGYTAAEGLILTGQGSTNDVTIKNDADAEVMGVLTGTTTAAFTGQVTGTGFTGTLDGILGGGTPAAATVTTLGFTSLSGTGAVAITDILDEDNMASNSATKLSTQQSIKAYVDTQVGTADTLAEVLVIGNTSGGTDLAISAGDDITFTDSSKAIFGADSDADIYHDGTNMYLKNDTGNTLAYSDTFQFFSHTGSELFAQLNHNSAVKLYFDSELKFETTATGVTVTGGTTSVGTGGVTIDATADAAANPELELTAVARQFNTGVGGATFATAALRGSYYIYDATATAYRFSINSSGLVGIGTTAPTGAVLHVSGASNQTIRVQNSSNNSRLSFVDSGTTADTTLFGSNSGGFEWYTSSALKMSLTSAGLVGLGIAAPTAELHIKAAAPEIVIQDGATDTFTSGAVSSSLSFQARNSSVRVLGQIDAIHESTNGTIGGMRFQTRTGDVLGERLRITSAGNVGIGTTDTLLFNAVGGSTKLAVVGDSASTSVTGKYSFLYINNQ